MYRPERLTDSIAGKDHIEELQVVGHLPRDPFIGRRRQGQSTSLGTLILQIVEEFAMVGQEAHIKGYPLADLSFQEGLSLEQPEREKKKIERVLLEQGEKGFDQQVRLDQGPVEVNNQRKGIHRLVRQIGPLIETSIFPISVLSHRNRAELIHSELVSAG